MSALFDPGLQPERTLLAWRRTWLSIGVGGAIVIRLAAEALGVLAVVLGGTVLLLAIAGGVLAGSRFRRTTRTLLATGRLPEDRGALLPLLAAVAAVVLGLGAAAFVVADAVGA